VGSRRFRLPALIVPASTGWDKAPDEALRRPPLSHVNNA
jgi:hypothetical protein